MTPKAFKTYPLLRPLSWLYGQIMAIRNRRFDSGRLHTQRFPVPVVSVGNISVGGTGKTPMCAYILKTLLGQNISPALLSRGYGRKSKGFQEATPSATAVLVGDEPLELFHRFEGRVPVFVCEDRCTGARLLLNHSPQVGTIVLDDAYQHRYIERDLNILLTDYSRLFTRDKVLPEGRLRERSGGVVRADIVVVTKCPPKLSSQDANAIRGEMGLRPGQRLFFTSICYDQSAIPKELENANVLLFTGIAKADPLINYYKERCRSLSYIRFADHHAFSPADIKRITHEATKAHTVVTTAKDFERLPHDLPTEIKDKLFVQQIDIVFLFGQATEFDNIITSLR